MDIGDVEINNELGDVLVRDAVDCIQPALPCRAATRRQRAAASFREWQNGEHQYVRKGETAAEPTRKCGAN